MITKLNKLLMLILVVTALSSVTSCRKDKFDEPNQMTEDPNLDTISISRLKAMYTGGSPITITEDVTIAGIVVGNDISGNIFEAIFIDDGNRAMPILINRSALYGDFPVGRKIYVKCKGLTLGTYGGFLQLGGYANGVSVEGIEPALISKYIVKGPTGYSIDSLIQTVTITNLNSTYAGRLIKLENVEFEEASAGIPFADVNLPVPTTGERNLKDCDNKKIIVRNSAYSKFAFELTPTESGFAYGIYTTYSSGFSTEKQLLLRDASDLHLTDTLRCSPLTVYTPSTILNLRSKFLGSTVNVGEGLLITGVVISSVADSNNLEKNLTIQDATGGIVVRLASFSPNFNKGDQVRVKIAMTDQLSQFSSGSLQIGTIQNSNVVKIASNVSVTPQIITIATLKVNFNDYESELIQINGVIISGASGKYNGTITFTDVTDNIGSFVRTANPSAEFVNQSYPTGTVSVVGYANLNSGTKQLILRNTADVTP